MNTNSFLGPIEPEVSERLLSRRAAILKGASASSMVIAGMAMASVPVAIAAMAKDVYGQGTPSSVIDVLNFALTLEYLESTFYTTGVGTTGLIPTADQPIFNTIATHESQHVNFLKTAIASLGGTPVAKPNFDFTAKGAFPNPFLPANYATFQALAQAFEDTGVRAYKGQAGSLVSNPAVLTNALQIHSIEARHASEVRRLRGNFADTAPHKGWITGNQTDIPGTTAVYAGEENTAQPPVTTPLSAPNTTAVQEAFDEPLTKDQVLAIVGPFLA